MMGAPLYCDKCNCTSCQARRKQLAEEHEKEQARKDTDQKLFLIVPLDCAGQRQRFLDAGICIKAWAPHCQSGYVYREGRVKIIDKNCFGTLARLKPGPVG